MEKFALKNINLQKSEGNDFIGKYMITQLLWVTLGSDNFLTSIIVCFVFDK